LQIEEGMMFKEYRLRKLHEKLAKYKAEYEELVRIMGTVTGTNSYYMNRAIKYQGIITELETRINNI